MTALYILAALVGSFALFLVGEDFLCACRGHDSYFGDLGAWWLRRRAIRIPVASIRVHEGVTRAQRKNLS